MKVKMDFHGSHNLAEDMIMNISLNDYNRYQGGSQVMIVG